MKKIIALITLIIVLVCINYGTGYIAGRLLARFINTNAAEYTGIPISVRNVTVNPVNLVFTFTDIAVQKADGNTTEEPLVIDSVLIDIEWMPVFFRKLIVERMEINNPRCIIRRGENREFMILPAMTLAPLSNRIRSRWSRKYPPATFEKTVLSGGKIGYSDGSNRIDFENVHIAVSRFWRSPGRKRLNIVFSAETDIKGGKGAIGIKGDYSLEQDKHSFSGELIVSKLDLPSIKSFFMDSIPVDIQSGRLSITGKPVCTENMLNTILHVNFDGLAISALPGKPKIGGIPVAMVQEFLDSTQGALRSDLQITGTLLKPEFQWNEFLTQIISQKLKQEALKKIDKKAAKAAGKISDILKKSRKE